MNTDNKELTLKQRSWLAVYIETGNATEAAMQAYDCKDRNSAKVIGSQNLTKLNFIELLEEMGLSDVTLVKTLLNGLQATKQLSVRGGKDATAQNDDFIEVEDYPTRYKYMETGFKLKGRLDPKTINSIIEPMQIRIIRDERMRTKVESGEIDL